ncbi:hypothetical protein [Pseudonocardia sp. GCM10023141]|uniref:hypothetical protein n=1 Tax=Pseudonocardia sp. GCM10023141 TaxID=3252653 RepID=UPI00361CB5A5
MIENSAAGLFRLTPDNEVVVTREEFHQPALARYAPRPDGQPRKVVVELRIAPITHGRHAGQPGIEVWLDARRVGELTSLMSNRYGPIVADVLRRGGRPAADAVVLNGTRGIEVTVRLPDVPSGAHAAPPFVPVPPAAPAAPGAPRASRRLGKPLLIGAGVVVGLLVIGGISGGRTTPAASSTGSTPVAAATSSATATPTPTPEPPAVAAPEVPPAVAAPDTKPVSRAQPPVAAPQAAPKPTVAQPPVAQPPVAQPPVAQPPAAKPPAVAPPAPKPPAAAPPASGCNSNYSGCVPIASDVDCQGGSGNGPAYVKGPVNVIGTDVYGLDSDNDGIGCE